MNKMNELQKAKFEEATESVMRFINEEPTLFNPHMKIIIDSNSVEVVSGEMKTINNDYIKD